MYISPDEHDLRDSDNFFWVEICMIRETQPFVHVFVAYDLYDKAIKHMCSGWDRYNSSLRTCLSGGLCMTQFYTHMFVGWAL